MKLSAVLRFAAGAGAMLAMAASAVDFAEVKARVENAKTPDYKAIEVLRAAAAGLKSKEFAALGVAACSEALKSDDMMTRLYAARALGRLDDKSAIPPLLAAIKDADANVRIEALRSLGAVGDASVLAVLAETAQARAADAEGDAARSSLKTIPGDDVVSAMLASAKDAAQPGVVRVEMIRALAARRLAAASPVFAELARGDKNEKVRSAALQAMGEAGEASSAPILLECLKSAATDADRDAAAAAFAALLLKSGTPKAEIDKVLAEVKSAPAGKRAGWCKVLALAGWPNAADTVEGLASGTVVPTLLEAVKSAKSEDERAAAADALAGIVRRAGSPEAEVKQVVSAAEAAAGTPELELALVNALAFIGGAEAVGAVETWLSGAGGNDDQSRTVIKRLGKSADLAALAAVEQFLADIEDGLFEAKFKPDVAAAYLELAASLARQHEEAQTALKKIREKAVADDDKERAKRSEEALASQWTVSF